MFDANGCYVTPGLSNAQPLGRRRLVVAQPRPAARLRRDHLDQWQLRLLDGARAPAEEDRQNVIDIFNYFEDIPEEPMRQIVPWDWTKWSEYKASMERNVRLPLNFCSFCGHIPMRLSVMGQDAWNRAATADEIAQMCALLEDALAAGAMGLSSNFLDYDKYERPLPSQLADDAELEALMAVVARYPDATFQVILDYFMRHTANEQSRALRQARQGRPACGCSGPECPRSSS